MNILWPVILIVVSWSSHLRGQDASGMCLNYGCDSELSYSQFTMNDQKIPLDNVKLLWSHAYSGPFGQIYLGCVATSNLMVCPATTPVSNSFVGINSTGQRIWTDDIYRVPLLPIMDTYGDMIVTDGTKIGSMLPNGSVPGFDTVADSNLVRPLYNPIMTEDDIFLIASENGILISYYSEGIPHASFFLNDTIAGVKGCFMPSAQPAIHGHRAYLLTVFKPQDSSQRVNCRRLVGFDLLPQMMPRDVVMWTFDLDWGCYWGAKEHATNRFEQSGVYGVTNDTVSVHNKHIFLTIQDTIYNSDFGKREIVTFKDEGTFCRHHYTVNFPARQVISTNAPFYNGSYVWGVDQAGGVILGYDVHDDSSFTVPLSEYLGYTNVTITSKATVLSEEPDGKLPVYQLEQYFVMGVSVHNGNKTPVNYIICLQVGFVHMPQLHWAIPTPNNCAIYGQIALMLPDTLSHSRGSVGTQLVGYCDGNDEGVFFAVG